MISTGEIVKILFQVFVTLFKGFSVLLIPVALFILTLGISLAYFYIKMRFVDGIKPIENEMPRIRKTSIFEHIFILFPKQLVHDILHRDPNEFNEYGIHIVTGEQGAGKTMTVVHLLQTWQKKYRKMEVYTNMDYKYEDDSLDTWKQLLERENGKFGIANVIDEIKVWFSNIESKNVPVEVLGEISQQRKQKKAIIGTVQVFSEMAKPFRSQTHFVYVPKTLFGCLTIVKVTKAKYYDKEKDRFRKYTNIFLFAHTKKYREAYDTYLKIEKYKENEFTSTSSQYFRTDSEEPPVVEVALSEVSKKRK